MIFLLSLYYPLITCSFLFSKSKNSNEVVVEVITAIPLSSLPREDRKIWRLTQNGCHSVISSYHLHKQMLVTDQGSSSTSQRLKYIWSFIWNLKATNGVKVFIWTACKEILLTNQNLFKRRILDKSKWTICLTDDESTAHVLWSFPTPHDTWNQTSPKIQKISFHSQVFMDIWDHLVGQTVSVGAEWSSLHIQATLAENKWGWSF